MNEIPELKEKQNLLGKFSNIFIERYRVAYLVVIAIILIGGLFYQQLPRESFPDSAFNAAVTYALYPGASAEDVEASIVNPIEKKLNDVDGVESVTAIAQEGVGQVIVQYDYDKNPEDMLRTFRSKVSEIDFPDGVSDFEIIEFTTSEIPIFRFAITGDYDLTELKNIGVEYQKDIEAINGVTKVELVGGYDREIRVEFDYDQLSKHNLNVNTVRNAIQSTNINYPIGGKALDGENFSLRVNESFESIEDVRNLIISSSGNATLRLKDIAKVYDGYADVESFSSLYVNVKGKSTESNPAVYLSVFRDGGTDTVGIGNQIKNLIEEGKGSIYPSDMTFFITQDDSVQVQEDLNSVVDNAVSGLLVVIVVLFLFIGFRESLIVATVIPLSLLISIIAMHYTGLTFNQLTLMGFIIALGMLVDNAIVVMENIDRLRDKGLGKIDAAKVGLNQIAPAILAATLTTVVAFVPLASLSGALGQTIKSLPLTIIFVLSASLFVSLAITPVLSSRFLSEFKISERDRSKGIKGTIRKYGAVLIIFALTLYAFEIDGKFGVFAWSMAIIFAGLMYFKQCYLEKNAEKIDEHNFISKYGDFLKKLVSSRWKRILVAVISLIVFIASIATIPLGVIDLETFPQEEASNFTINITAPTGYLLNDTKAVVYDFEKILFEYESIESYNTDIGSFADNEARITVELVDDDYRNQKTSEIINELLVKMKSIPGAEFRISEQRQQGGPPTEAPIKIGLRGQNLEELKEYADQYLEVLEEIDGVRNPYSNASPGLRQVKINVNNEKAANLGLSPAMIATSLSNSINGINLGTFKDANDEVDIVGYVDNKRIESVKDFEKINFINPRGQRVNFTDVCDLTFDEGISIINHESLERVVYIQAQTFQGVNTKNVIDEFNKKVNAIQLPIGVERYDGGELENLDELINDIIRSLIIAIILVFIVLALQFNSLTQPIVILISVPLAFIGVVIGLIVTNNPLGAYAMMGGVALVGIAVNDAIVLVDFANYLRAQGKDKYEAITGAVKTRFMPVLATSLTTMGGVLPLALKNPTFEQMAYVIIFGLFASTVLTLFIIPNIYIINDNLMGTIKNKFGIFQD